MGHVNRAGREELALKLASFHPGQFPVGSPVSRAAARSLIEERRAHAKLVDLVISVDPSETPWFSEWHENDNDSFTRRSRVPRGMAFEDAEKAAGLSPLVPKGDYTRLTLTDHGSEAES